MHQIGSLGIRIKPVGLPQGREVSLVLRMMAKQWTAVGVASLLFLLTLGAAAQQQGGSKEDIPDAPSASRPPQPFPSSPPVEPQGQPPSEATADQPPSANEAPPSSSRPAPPVSDDNASSAPHPLDAKTAPEGGATPDAGTSSQAELYKLSVN